RGGRGYHAPGEARAEADSRGSEPSGPAAAGEALLHTERVESGGGAGLRGEARGTEGRSRAGLRSEGGAGPGDRVPCLGAGGRRAVREAPEDHPTVSRDERDLRQHDPGQKLLFPERASAEGDAADVPRRGPWVAVPVPRFLR